MRAESLPITRETSVERITRRVRQRTKDKNENAVRLRRKGKPDRTESRLRVDRLVGEDSHKLDKQSREDDDKRARPNEERAARAIETTEAYRVFHGIKSFE